MPPEILHTDHFLDDAVALIAGVYEEAVRERGIFRIALSGGNTPRPVYRALADKPLDWDRWEVTFGDERCVPPDRDQSNFRMARESLFDHAPIPAANILRMRGPTLRKRRRITRRSSFAARREELTGTI